MYFFSGDGDILDPKEVLDRSQGPTVGHMSLLATQGDMPPRYTGTSLIRNSPLPGPYSRNIPRVLGGSHGGLVFLMGEVPLYPTPPLENCHYQTMIERRAGRVRGQVGICRLGGLKLRCPDGREKLEWF